MVNPGRTWWRVSRSALVVVVGALLLTLAAHVALAAQPDLPTVVMFPLRGNAPKDARRAATLAVHLSLTQRLDPTTVLVLSPEEWAVQLSNQGKDINACKDVACDLDLARQQRLHRAFGGEVMVVGDTAYCTLKVLQPWGVVDERTFEAPLDKLPAVLEAGLTPLLRAPPLPNPDHAPPDSHGIILVVVTQAGVDAPLRFESSPDASSFVWNMASHAISLRGTAPVTLTATELKGLPRDGKVPDVALCKRLVAAHNADDLVFVRVTLRAPANARGLDGTEQDVVPVQGVAIGMRYNALKGGVANAETIPFSGRCLNATATPCTNGAESAVANLLARMVPPRGL